MNKSYYYSSVITIIGALAASALIIPDKKEVALMQMEDGNLQEAFKRYQLEASKGNFSLDVAMPLSKLYLQYGDVDNAIWVMEQFIARYPDETAAHTQLGALYKSAGRLEDYLAYLQKAATKSPSNETLRELIELSDFLCRDEVKKTALAQLIASHSYSPEEKDYTTLAYLYANDGQYSEALEVLKSFIAFKEYVVSRESMDLTLQLLMDNGYIADAFDMASIYLSKQSKGEEAARVMALFRINGKPEMALKLSQHFQKVAMKDKAFQEEYITNLLATGKETQAQELLLSHLKQRTLSGNQPQMLMDLALKHNDVSLLKELAGTIPLNTVPEETLTQCAEMALITNNRQLADMLKENVGAQFLANAPVLAMLLEGTDMALSQAQSEPLTAAQTLTLARIYASRKNYAALLQLAEKLPVPQMIEHLDAFDIAGMYLSAGAAEAGISRYHAARKEAASSVITQEIDMVLLFLAAGSGDAPLFALQEKQLGGLNAVLLSDCYSLAASYGQDAFLLTLAALIYERDKTPANQLQYMEALLNGKRYKDALLMLSSMVNEGKDVDNYYLDAVAGLIREHQSKELQPHQESFFKVVDNLLARPHVKEVEKRNAAYLLLHAGFQEKAESVFFTLAKDQEAESPDVRELLFLAGLTPSPAIRAWLRERAAGETGPEQALWLGYLNNIGEEKAVIAVVEQQKQSLNTPEVADAYIEALSQTKSHTALAAVLTTELEKGTSPERYRKLAMLAVSEGLEKVAEKHLRHLLALSPNDTLLLHQLGLYSFYKGRYQEAETYLTHYFEYKEGNHETYYAYAEILWNKQDYEKARHYYQLASIAAEWMPERDFATRVREAHILYRQGKIKESAGLYRALLQEQPHNNALKSDFANMLIERRQFGEAEQVLAE